jgi:hypothetical protein
MVGKRRRGRGPRLAGACRSKQSPELLTSGILYNLSFSSQLQRALPPGAAACEQVVNSPVFAAASHERGQRSGGAGTWQEKNKKIFGRGI